MRARRSGAAGKVTAAPGQAIVGANGNAGVPVGGAKALAGLALGLAGVALALAGIAMALAGVAGAVVGVAPMSDGAAVAAQLDPSPEGAVSVRGTSTLVGQLNPGVTSLEDGVVRARGNVLVTLEETDDPRVSGQAIIRVNIDAYPGADGTAAVAQVRFGEMRLENDDGAWEGWFTGRLNRSGFTQTYWLEGEGAYEGLTYVVTAGGDGSVWLSDGLIYPGEVPPSGSANRLPVESQDRDVPAA